MGGHNRKYTKKEARRAATLRATKWAKDNPERRKELSRENSARYPWKSCEKEAKRRARKREQVCECCTSKSLGPIYEFAQLLGMEVDHIIPLSRGGLHCETNLQLLPPSLNRSKGAKVEGRIPE